MRPRPLLSTIPHPLGLALISLMSLFPVGRHVLSGPEPNPCAMRLPSMQTTASGTINGKSSTPFTSPVITAALAPGDLQGSQQHDCTAGPSQDQGRDAGPGLVRVCKDDVQKRNCWPAKLSSRLGGNNIQGVQYRSASSTLELEAAREQLVGHQWRF